MIRASAIVLILMGAALASGAPLPPAGTDVLKGIREARRAGDLDKAEKLLKDYESRKGDPETAQLEWLLLRAQGGETAARKALIGLLAKNKDANAALVLEALARGFVADERFNDALKMLEEWLKRDPNSIDALYLRGWVIASLGAEDDAVSDFRQILKLQPKHPEAELALATVLMESHKYDDAIPLFERSREARKDDPAPVVRLARCWYNTGETEKAVKPLDELLIKQPKQIDALAERGKIANQTGDPEKAESLLRKALAVDPMHQMANYHMSISLRRLGKIKEAAAQEERNRRVDKDADRLHTLIGIALRRSPEDPEVRHEIGTLLARLNRDKEALRWWKNLLLDNPDYAPTHRALADYYEKAGKTDLAEQHRKLAEGKK